MYLGESSRALEYLKIRSLPHFSLFLNLAVVLSPCLSPLLPSLSFLRYFEMLGFVIPPLVNPPDFFLDVISGEVERQGHPDFVPKDLFDLWEQNRHKYLFFLSCFCMFFIPLL